MTFKNVKHAIGIAIAVCAGSLSASEPIRLEPPQPNANERLLTHQERFAEPEIITVRENIHVAHGFDMCNMIFVEGPDGLIVMDTGLREEKAALAIAAIREITDKPIVAVFYSHGHGDHVGGSGAFRNEAPNADFYAFENWQRNINHIASAVRPAFTLRAVSQLGLLLPEGMAGTVGSGGGPVLRIGGTLSYVVPTKTVSDGEWLEIAGLRFQAIHTPGDLDDGLSLWFPEFEAILTGDAITESFVHVILATPRHEPGRDAQGYVESLTRIGSFDADVLIGGHGDVVDGRDAVRSLVRSDRRSAQFIIDEVMRRIRQNQTADQVQAELAYPDWFSQGAERGDYYHKLSWIARGVYNQHMGSFTGDAATLSPVSPAVRADRIVAGFDGVDGSVIAIEEAYGAGDFHWAVELSSYVIAVAPDNDRARELKSWSLRSIAYASESANERNYLLTQAQILDGAIPLAFLQSASARRGLPEYYRAADANVFLHTLGARLNVEAARESDIAFKVEVVDRDEAYSVEIDHGVLLTSPYDLQSTDFTIRLEHQELANLSEGLSNWDEQLAKGAISVAGDQAKFAEFAALF
ncbi:alkyl sulfatase dimerization domain-containing protein [Erythrobacter sp. Alg231-14]|uniref:alkyl sulfatase dimerization domain-containing protein n=1 Tax=Erythrobacter sp. Alg231-14 TaxID=1922225 RepID=UPI000D5609A7